MKLKAYNRRIMTELVMNRISVILAEVPKFATDEYHPDQVRFYALITELAFKALTVSSIVEFAEKLVNQLSLKNVKVKVDRMPSRRSKAALELKDGKAHLVCEALMGCAHIQRREIEIYPSILWPDKLSKPAYGIPIGVNPVENAVKALFHEMLHLSGLRDEYEARRRSDQYYRDFRQNHPKRFGMELKPFLEEWFKALREVWPR